MAPGGRFYATFFEAAADTPYDQRVKQVVRHTSPERDPFHYRRDDLRWAAESVADWSVRYIGDWGHRRGQQMMEYALRAPRGQALASARRAAGRLRRRARRAERDS
jgi:hypothetical protein